GEENERVFDFCDAPDHSQSSPWRLGVVLRKRSGITLPDIGLASNLPRCTAMGCWPSVPFPDQGSS
ncbi:MAG TPA: hypothetical protein PKC60_16065, partial [Hydrogenophaga sp.]|uniref:hypothetical protein n=1 Tax=Hydrogenophaga sp. TaxID=1904254 RepID=UPI002BCD1C02